MGLCFAERRVLAAHKHISYLCIRRGLSLLDLATQTEALGLDILEVGSKADLVSKVHLPRA